MSITLEGQQGSKEYYSQYFEEKNYRISYFEIKPSVTYQPFTGQQLKVFYNLRRNENQAENVQKSEIQTFGSEYTLRNTERGSLSLNLNYYSVNSDEDLNGSILYEMLQGLQPGKNFTWGAGVQRRIGNYLRLDFSYSGRKTGDEKTIHVASLQLRAVF